MAPGLWDIASCAFLAALAGVLFAEGRGRPAWVRVLLSALLGAGTGALLAFPDRTLPSVPLVQNVAICAVLLAPFGFGRGDNEAFWWHAARVTSGAGTALLGAVVLLAGGMVLESSVRVLFLTGSSGLVPFYTSTYLMPVAFGLVAPLIWLSRMPQPDAVRAAVTMEVRAPLAVARWVVVPLLLVYAAVLIAYAARIAWLGTVPAGQIGRYVPAFGGLGTFVFLMLQHERGKGNRLVDAFSLLWFPLMVVPLALLGAALWLRIEPFGFTVQRGHLLIMAAWLGIITLLFAPRLGRGDLRLIPAVLMGLSLVFAAGPLGLAALANRDQAERLVALLSARGLVDDGHLVADAAGKPLELKDRAQAQSIVRYLGRNHGLHLLAPLFAGRDDDPFRKAERPQATAIEMRITGFPRDVGRVVAAPDPRYFISVTNVPSLIAEAGGVRVLGPFQAAAGRGEKAVSVDGIEASFEDNAVLVKAADGRTARLDIAAAIQARADEAVGTPPRLQGPLRIETAFGDERIVVVLQGGTLSVSRSRTALSGASYFLVIQPAR